MDPVTIAILAPVAVKCAEIAAPYVWRGVQNGGRHLLKMGENIFDLFRLPVGILQATLGSPFGMFSSGMKNIVSGTLAPLSLTLNSLLLPLAFSGFILSKHSELGSVRNFAHILKQTTRVIFRPSYF